MERVVDFSLKEISKEVPPEHVYHYTSQQGLYGIIKSKSIWATNIYFLNDLKEYYRGCDIIMDELRNSGLDFDSKKYTGHVGSGVSEDFLKSTEHFLYNLKDTSTSIYICSFSEHRDDLSQWRGYCEIGKGYCLGFKSRSFMEYQKTNSFFVKCRYSEPEQRELVRRIIEWWQSFLRDFGINLKEWKEIDFGGFLQFALKGISGASALKDWAFKDENEWRLVIISPSKTEDIEFRDGNSFLIPFIKVTPQGEFRNTLQSITIGPSIYPDHAKLAIKQFTANEGIDNCDIIDSKIPYRSC